jgi:GntR family transcriptional regulator/MocR family aminotransferase
VWVEEPCSPVLRVVVQSAGARLHAVAVDDQGMGVPQADNAAPPALIYVTPSCQVPLGLTMTAERRADLLRCAEELGAWVLEDDRGAELLYGRARLPAIQQGDRTGRVVFFGTLADVLHPVSRLSYLVVPPALVSLFRRASVLLGGPVGWLEQAVLAELVGEGELIAYARRIRHLCQERRSAVLEAAQQELVGLLSLGMTPAATHLVGWLGSHVDEAAVEELAARRALAVMRLAPYYMHGAPRPGLLLGYAPFTPSALRAAVRQLGEALRALPRQPGASGLIEPSVGILQPHRPHCDRRAGVD